MNIVKIERNKKNFHKLVKITLKLSIDELKYSTKLYTKIDRGAV